MIENLVKPRKKVVKTTDRIFGLDLMRAVSIVMVFLCHSTPLNPLDSYFPFTWLGMGVEAFFVLSGLLIGRIILRTVLQPGISRATICTFWINR